MASGRGSAGARSDNWPCQRTSGDAGLSSAKPSSLLAIASQNNFSASADELSGSFGMIIDFTIATSSGCKRPELVELTGRSRCVPRKRKVPKLCALLEIGASKSAARARAIASRGIAKQICSGPRHRASARPANAESWPARRRGQRNR